MFSDRPIWIFSLRSPSYLSWAKLSRAKLTEANLTGANLPGANLAEPVCRMDFGGWSIFVRVNQTSIGCQTHPNADWLRWSPDDVAHMDCRASEWWRVHGDAVKSAIRCVMAKAAAASTRESEG